METIIILLKSRDLVKPNQFKIFGYGNLAALLLTIVSFAGMVAGQFHMTNITQMPQPGEQVIDNGDGGDVSGGGGGGDEEGGHGGHNEMEMSVAGSWRTMFRLVSSENLT